MIANLEGRPPKNWKVHKMPQRHSVAQHLTASGVVLYNGHVLLIHHKRIGAWLPPGGHVEDMELPHEAVVREVFEETGVAVEVLSPPLPDTGDGDAFLLPSPLCMHAVQAIERGIACYHVDLAYLCRPRFKSVESDESDESEWIESSGGPGAGQASAQDLPELVDNEEVHDCAWVPLGKLADYRLAKNVLEVLSLALGDASSSQVHYRSP